MSGINIEGYRARVVDDTVAMGLRVSGAVCIQGPKWCGKTRTALAHSKSAFMMMGLTDQGYPNRQLALNSLRLVLDGETPRTIDEWQEVPSIWDAVRYEVDRRGAKGQFILTGSSTPVKEGIMHSGAGRIARVGMRTMSLWESGDSQGEVSLAALFDGDMQNKLVEASTLQQLIYLTVRGGWPANIGMDAEDAFFAVKNYIDIIVEEDFGRAYSTNASVVKLRKVLASLARNESTVATKAKLLADIVGADEKFDPDTLSKYLEVLGSLFLLADQPQYTANIRSSVKVGKGAKRHLTDPSLACALLDATPQKLLGDLNTFGMLFEALCERDLEIYAEAIGGKLYHYRDYRGDEIDAVVELSDGRWGAFEIKLGANQIDAAAANLTKMRDKIAQGGGKTPAVMCVICGLANAIYRRADGVCVVPITMLKP